MLLLPTLTGLATRTMHRNTRSFAVGCANGIEEVACPRTPHPASVFADPDFTPVDGTLSLLANAAGSRGLPHTVARNLALMTGTHIHRTYNAGFGFRSTWKPQLPADAVEYRVPRILSKGYNRIVQMRELRAQSERALDAFSEVVRMAEARHHLTLGRVLPR